MRVDDHDSLVHQKTTDQLQELLDIGIELCESFCVSKGNFSFGPILGKVSSNHSEIFSDLTYCLMPESKTVKYFDVLSLHILCGSDFENISMPTWNFPHTNSRHLERLHIGDDITAYFDADLRFWHVVDHKSKRALFWIHSPDAIPFWERAAPFKNILNWFLALTPFTIVHGGVISQNGRGILLVGPGGSGKSTTVINCLSSGFQVCGDDLIIVGLVDNEFKGYLLYNSIKLKAHLDSCFPKVGFKNSELWRSCGDKKFTRYTDLSADGVCASTRIIAVMHCLVSNLDQTKISPITPNAILKYILPPTVFMLRGWEELSIKKISRLVRGVKTYELSLGEDLAEVCQLLSVFIREYSNGQ